MVHEASEETSCVPLLVYTSSVNDQEGEIAGDRHKASSQTGTTVASVAGSSVVLQTSSEPPGGPNGVCNNESGHSADELEDGEITDDDDVLEKPSASDVSRRILEPDVGLDEDIDRIIEEAYETLPKVPTHIVRTKSADCPDSAVGLSADIVAMRVALLKKREEQVAKKEEGEISDTERSPITALPTSHSSSKDGTTLKSSAEKRGRRGDRNRNAEKRQRSRDRIKRSRETSKRGTRLQTESDRKKERERTRTRSGSVERRKAKDKLRSSVAAKSAGRSRTRDDESPVLAPPPAPRAEMPGTSGTTPPPPPPPLPSSLSAMILSEMCPPPPLPPTLPFPPRVVNQSAPSFDQLPPSYSFRQAAPPFPPPSVVPAGNSYCQQISLPPPPPPESSISDSRAFSVPPPPPMWSKSTSTSTGHEKENLDNYEDVGMEVESPPPLDERPTHCSRRISTRPRTLSLADEQEIEALRMLLLQQQKSGKRRHEDASLDTSSQANSPCGDGDDEELERPRRDSHREAGKRRSSHRQYESEIDPEDEQEGDLTAQEECAGRKRASSFTLKRLSECKNDLLKADRRCEYYKGRFSDCRRKRNSLLNKLEKCYSEMMDAKRSLKESFDEKLVLMRRVVEMEDYFFERSEERVDSHRAKLENDFSMTEASGEELLAEIARREMEQAGAGGVTHETSISLSAAEVQLTVQADPSVAPTESTIAVTEKSQQLFLISPRKRKHLDSGSEADLDQRRAALLAEQRRVQRELEEKRKKRREFEVKHQQERREKEREAKEMQIDERSGGCDNVCSALDVATTSSRTAIVRNILHSEESSSVCNQVQNETRLRAELQGRIKAHQMRRSVQTEAYERTHLYELRTFPSKRAIQSAYVNGHPRPGPGISVHCPKFVIFAEQQPDERKFEGYEHGCGHEEIEMGNMASPYDHYYYTYAPGEQPEPDSNVLFISMQPPPPPPPPRPNPNQKTSKRSDDEVTMDIEEVEEEDMEEFEEKQYGTTNLRGEGAGEQDIEIERRHRIDEDERQRAAEEVDLRRKLLEKIRDSRDGGRRCSSEDEMEDKRLDSERKADSAPPSSFASDSSGPTGSSNSDSCSETKGVLDDPPPPTHIDPTLPLCTNELVGGDCSDESCKMQHLKERRLIAPHTSSPRTVTLSEEDLLLEAYIRDLVADVVDETFIRKFTSRMMAKRATYGGTFETFKDAIQVLVKRMRIPEGALKKNIGDKPSTTSSTPRTPQESGSPSSRGEPGYVPVPEYNSLLDASWGEGGLGGEQ